MPSWKKVIVSGSSPTLNELTLSGDATTIGSNFTLANTTGDLTITNNANDKDVIFQSDDGSGGTTAYLTLDGSATQISIAKNMKFGDGVKTLFGAGEDVQLFHDSTYGGFLLNQTNDFYFDQVAADKDWIFRVDDSDGGGDYQEVMRIKGSTQRVGIGTNSPEGKVHIFNGDASIAPDGDGDELVVENSGDSGISILSGESSTHTGALIFGSANDAFGAALQYSYHGNDLRLMTANTGHSLEFASDNNTTAMTIDSSQDVKIEESLGIGVAASSTTGRLDCSNDVVAFSTSDKRLKDNIVHIENPLEKIQKIGGYTFDWKPLTEEEKKTIHGNEGHDVGVIAQEIQEVLPEVVTERDSGYKAVDYEKIVPLLIESIKELKQEVDDIKQKCDCLNK